MFDMEEAVAIYSVSDLNSVVRQLLDENFPLVWVSGEISNLSIPRSGHLYFSLKDEHAQVRCAMFKGQNKRLDFIPEDGMQILVHAKISLYEPRGDFQLIIYEMEVSGDALLRQKFEALKKKLAKEGLFDETYKREIPKFPHCLGIVTSPTGAAIHDVLTVLKHRFPGLPVIIYPTEVQGDTAAAAIAKAIETANKRNESDVLLVTRGGGSLEDLWPFNEEIVARAIFASKIPIVSAIGHEVDFTISDFVADVRAATPSAAAERITPNQQECLENLNNYLQQLFYLVQNQLKHLKLQCISLQKRLRHPGEKLQMQQQHLDYLEQTLLRIMQHRIQTEQHKLSVLACTLDNISPLQTLKRGYAIVEKNKQIITEAKQITIGDHINAHLARGKISCKVEKIDEIAADNPLLGPYH